MGRAFLCKSFAARVLAVGIEKEGAGFKEDRERKRKPIGVKN